MATKTAIKGEIICNLTLLYSLSSSLKLIIYKTFTRHHHTNFQLVNAS